MTFPAWLKKRYAVLALAVFQWDESMIRAWLVYDIMHTSYFFLFLLLLQKIGKLLGYGKYRQADTQMDTRVDTQMDRQADTQTGRHTD